MAQMIAAVAALLAFMIWGPRFLGALATVARPLRGLEARPAYWEFGLAAIGLIGAVLVFLWGVSGPGGGLGVASVAGAVAAVGLWRWFRFRVELDGEVLLERGGLTGVRRIRLGDIESALPDGTLSLVVRTRAGPPLRVPLSMDGLDTVYAGLARAGVRGLDWPAFQAARRFARRR